MLKQDSMNSENAKIGPHSKKRVKEFKNRSSEFFKNDLNNIMKQDSSINRNSNELWGYKKNMTNDKKFQGTDNRRMYASGYRFPGTQEKLQHEKPMSLSQNCSLNASDNQGSLKESMTRK